MKCFVVRATKKVDIQRVSIVALCILMVGCGGSPSVQAPPAHNYRREVKPSAVTVLPPAPKLESAVPTTVVGGTQIELLGSGFEDGAVAEVLAANGEDVIKSVEVLGDAVKRTAVLQGVIAAGVYKVRIRNANGQLSNLVSLSLEMEYPGEAPTRPNPCRSGLGGSSMTLYLGGGDAAKIFDMYMNQNADIAAKLPYQVKIKFYEPHDSGLTLQVVSLGEFEDLFVESRNDFVERLRGRLQGRTADLTSDIERDAENEKAQYFLCTFNPTTGG